MNDPNYFNSTPVQSCGQNTERTRDALPVLPGGEDFQALSSHAPVENQAETKRPIRPMASRRLVRPDYHRQVKITYAEAAVIAGVGVNTVEKWVSAGILPRVAKVGPYRIDRMALDKFLAAGIPPNSLGRRK